LGICETGEAKINEVQVASDFCGLEVFCFWFAGVLVEEVIKRLIHGADLAEAFRDIRLEQFASRAIIVFCVFIALFCVERIPADDG